MSFLRLVGMIGCCVLIFDPSHPYWVHGLFLSGIVSWLGVELKP